jgi:ATP-binding cassette, subfamily C, bacterial exporter for protease/lipase
MQKPSSLQLLGILRWDASEWLTVLFFTGLINLLMLTPTIYMLQIYDRVVVSGSLLTLLAVSLVVLFLFGMMAAADWFRSRLLVRVGQLIDRRLAPDVFRAAYRDRLQGRSATATEHLADLTQVRQFLTGSGFLNLIDMPWIPVYVANWANIFESLLL